MGIVGMTKAVSGENISKLPRIAMLRKGAPKEVRTNNKGKQYEVVGKDLHYFRIDFETPFKHLLPIWESLYGYEPDEFRNVRLVGNTVDEAFENWREEWTAATMLHRCDGVNQSCYYNTETHKYVNATTPCCSPIDPVTGGQKIGCACKPRGRLKLLFPQFIAETNVLGYIEVGTTSINDIMEVAGYLAGIEALVGGLANVPFRFGRAPREISTPKQEKQGDNFVTTGRAVREKSMFFIQVMPGYVGQNILPMIDGEQVALPAPTVQFGMEEALQITAGEGAEKKAESAAWINDPQKLEKFLTWAKVKFNFDLEHVITAFNRVVDDEITNVTQWAKDGEFSMAAVITAAHEYNSKKIERFLSKDNYKPEVFSAAVAIVQRVEAEEAQAVE